MKRIVCIFCLLVGLSLSDSGAILAQEQRRIPVLIDTDIGDDIDDAFALALALASPELDVRGITTVHGDAYTRAHIVCRWLHALGRKDISVATGAPPRAKPSIQGQLQYGLRPAFRLRPEKQSAVDFLYQLLKAKPGELTLVAIGPLTNIAGLLGKHPDAKGLIKRVVIMGGSVRRGYGGNNESEPEWNVKTDIDAAKAVFASGVPLTVAPLDATAQLKLEPVLRAGILRSNRPLNQELHALYQLWEETDPILFDPLAVTLAFTERFCRMEELCLAVDDKGFTRLVDGKPNARVALATKREEFLKWCAARLSTPGEKYQPHTIPLTNLVKPVAKRKFPDRVHVIEDYETDIERRWWLAGKEETKNVPPGDGRACRGVWTNDFDDRQGNPKAQYTAVIFNPVPGPPMGPKTRLSFRYWLKGTGNLRVQIYSLSNGYHRHLTLTGLPQGAWHEATVDMTMAQRPDGTGGTLADNERIDDIQFYTDADAELLIDDIVLYEAEKAGETRVFPSRPLFTGWFDTGKQGQEWPGAFAIVNKPKPWTWKAAQSVARPGTDENWIRLGLRGERFGGLGPQLRFRYFLDGKEKLTIVLQGKRGPYRKDVELETKKWAEAVVDFSEAFRVGDSVTEIVFSLPRPGELMIDDVLLFEK
ncbi:MAG: nucleoside hydrolase [Gemmataceae bacterium]|nr:nucleoside hydrolase [Gemmataceae bacterium]MCI0738853.1 nucleoside hydrolase [Gemmataceae bacterium]